MQPLLVVFITVFLAELGDKTQLATLLFATDRNHSPLMIFCAAALALLLSTALAVALGTMAERMLTGLPLKLIAGVGFVMVGAWTLWEHFNAA